MANEELEKPSYGAFERFLYFFLIPSIFTLFLLGVLLTLFNYDVKESVLKIANKIPILNNYIPDAENEIDPFLGADVEDNVEDNEKHKAELNEAEEQLALAIKDNEQKNNRIKELEESLQTLEEELLQQVQEEENTAVRVKELANLYGKMSARRAAPIMENLNINEQIMILQQMKEQERVSILERMDPEKAAAASIRLMDDVSLQQLKNKADKARNEAQNQNAANIEKLNYSELAQTFAIMDPESASLILTQMWSSNQNKVIAIMTEMASQSRSSVLSVMAESSDQGKTIAATIANRLTN